MAVAAVRPASRIPPSADRATTEYLRERERGAPSTVPRIIGLTSSILSGTRFDVLAWDFDQQQPPHGRCADFFVLYIEAANTVDPGALEVLLPATARTYTSAAPAGLTISYGIAAARATQSGLDVGPKVAGGAWRGVAGGVAAPSGFRAEVRFAELPDGARVTFTSPVVIYRDPVGVPVAILTRRGPGGRLSYTTSPTPQAFEWHLAADDVTVTVGEPPEAGDAFLLAIVAVR